jgi:hypothetical protein
LFSAIANARQEASIPHEKHQAGGTFNIDSAACVEAVVSPLRRPISSATVLTYAVSVKLLSVPLEIGTRAVETCLQQRYRELNVGCCRAGTMRGYCGSELQSVRAQAHDLERHVGGGAKRELYRGLPFRALCHARLWHVARGEELHCGFRFDRLNQLLSEISQSRCGFHQLRPIGNPV